MTEVCLRHQSVAGIHQLAVYESVGGYATWRALLAGKIKPEYILQELKRSQLRGRGGAGFLTSMKWQFMNRGTPGDKFLICNSDEGEPGTFKDTLIMKHNPHQLIEGIAICSYVIGASRAYNYIRGEYLQEYHQVERALYEAKEAGLLGANILGSGFNLCIENLLGAGSYIVGEETAMMESIEGKRAMPRNKPPFPAVSGLYGCPTTINNTETLASVPMIVSKGGDWFKSLGVENSGGTKIFCVSGHVVNPGTFELPMGVPMQNLIDLCGGVRHNRRIKAVIPGGTSMRVIPGHTIPEVTMDYDGLARVNSAVGSGGMIVMDETTSMPMALMHMMHFYHQESCGQCTPCREGSGWISQALKQLVKGDGSVALVDEIYQVASSIEGRTICAFGEAITWPVTSFIDHFREEFDRTAELGVKGRPGFEWSIT
ncbi:NADH-quinone oxidoreductase subunit NuoF [Candidatus Comchoanobacter bicostacola]|uniref:NADH-quinone oxidoreductase subunit NuoF n=2 Tax=Candidatus Comchoanobacter bicostacola TaxID=2919598 RepID=A0ABY5DLE7_9GAMM|nr:NADH-quinone oxidoreductase subunit NuoF [Candidatus Comchoanobacter bicostacola]UTC24788.1 NADH-quinone oxidoreductase subunit NuoF [Candidatus Comchoanobacter bicostacola]